MAQKNVSSNLLRDQQGEIVLHLVGQVNLTKTQATAPGGDLLGTHGEQHLTELFGLLIAVGIGIASTVDVELFVVKIFDGLGSRFHHALLFAHHGRCTIARRAVAFGNNQWFVGLLALGDSNDDA